MDAAVLETLRGVTTATVTMQLLKRGIRRTAMAGVSPLTPGGERVVGVAYTLRYIPMREDLANAKVLGAPDYAPRVAIEDCPPGAILTIDARSDADCGVIGDILAERLKQRGVAAVVTDGAVRDAVGVAGTGLAVWCAGAAAPASITTHAGGDLQSPIGCGDVAVIPGDVLVCDDDGVAVIPQALAAEVARDGAEQERLEAWIQARIAEGRPTAGLYPPNEVTLAEYEAFRKGQSQS